MILRNSFYCFIVLIILVNTSCSSNDGDYAEVPQSPVVLDLEQVPYPKLSDYHFFEGELKQQAPSIGVIPFAPKSTLFTDYAKKKRFIWLPEGEIATYNGDHDVIELPTGAALVKTFYYDNVQPANDTRIIETRIMIRKPEGWIFAEYVWNEEQTDAFLTTQGGTTDISWLENGVAKSTTYQIPNILDCFTCHHRGTEVLPIGIKPQNLNFNYSYADGSKNQLQKWIDVGYLEDDLPAEIASVVDYSDTSKSLDLRVRSYLDINCAHCHRDGGEAEFYVMRFAFSGTIDPANLGICMEPNHVVPGFSGSIVKPGDISKSMLHYRMNTVDPIYRMPLLGRTMKHQEGVDLVEQWINQLAECP